MTIKTQTQLEARLPKNAFALDHIRNSKGESQSDFGQKVVTALLVLGPSTSHESVDQFVQMASSPSAGLKVYLKYVVDMDPVQTLYLDKAFFGGLRQKAADAVERTAEKLRQAGMEVGAPPPHFVLAAEEVLRTERQIHPDVIVMDVPHQTRLQKMFDRDFSREVTKKAKALVVTIRDEQDQPKLQPQRASAVSGRFRLRTALFIGVIVALWTVMARQNGDYWSLNHLLKYSEWGSAMAAFMAVLWGLVAGVAIFLALTLARSQAIKQVSSKGKESQ